MRMMRFHYTYIALTLLCVSSATLAAEPVVVASKTSSAAEQTYSDWSGKAQEVLMNALSLTGIKYKYGGVSPETGFDCSGFVRYVFQQAADLTLPHGARAISQLGQAVTINQLQPGDLVFFNTLKSAFSHVGIYLGNNRFIHAASQGGGIQVVNLDDEYWTKRFNGGRRLDTNELSVAEKPKE